MTARIDHIVTSGTFSLDGGTWDVDNNVWIVGDDDECLVIDAAHDADAILRAVDGRRVRAIVCTHAHDDHVNVAPAVAEVSGAPILLNSADLVLWNMTHPDREPDGDLSDGTVLEIAGTELRVLHTPGARAGRGVPARRRPRCGVHRRHPVPRRTGCDRAVVLGLRDDHRIDSQSAADPSGRDRGAHRPR